MLNDLASKFNQNMENLKVFEFGVEGYFFYLQFLIKMLSVP